MSKNILTLNGQGELRHFPIPPAEQGLQTATADYWLQVCPGDMTLEGLCFDRSGNHLYVADVWNIGILKIDLLSKSVSTVCTVPMPTVAATKIHKDNILLGTWARILAVWMKTIIYMWPCAAKPDVWYLIKMAPLSGRCSYQTG